MANPEYSIKPAGKFKMNEVCDVDQAREMLRVQAEAGRYRDLANKSWEGYVLTKNHTPVDRYYAFGPTIDRNDLKVLFYAPAPRKFETFGTDEEDVVFDRNRLFYQPHNKDKLKAHRRIQNWDIYERDGRALTDCIEREDNSTFQPLLIWGRSTWIHSLHSAEVSDLWKAAGKPKSLREKANPLAGLLYLASYSADECSKWKEYVNFAGQEFENKLDGNNGMDPAQTPALVSMRADQIIRSTTCANIEQKLSAALGNS